MLGGGRLEQTGLASHAYQALHQVLAGLNGLALPHRQAAGVFKEESRILRPPFQRASHLIPASTRQTER